MAAVIASSDEELVIKSCGQLCTEAGQTDRQTDEGLVIKSCRQSCTEAGQIDRQTDRQMKDCSSRAVGSRGRGWTDRQTDRWTAHQEL